LFSLGAGLGQVWLFLFSFHSFVLFGVCVFFVAFGISVGYRDGVWYLLAAACFYFLCCVFVCVWYVGGGVDNLIS
jgi:hypothetical protein